MDTGPPQRKLESTRHSLFLTSVTAQREEKRGAKGDLVWMSYGVYGYPCTGSGGEVYGCRLAGIAYWDVLAEGRS